MREQPQWLTASLVQAIHLRQIREHGGHYGVRDRNLLESALARPMNRWLHEGDADIFVLAGMLCYALCRSHCFIDGNKRVAFMAMYTFLGLHGYEIEAPEPEIVDLMLAVAEGNIGEPELVEWLKTRGRSRAPQLWP